MYWWRQSAKLPEQPHLHHLLPPPGMFARVPAQLQALLCEAVQLLLPGPVRPHHLAFVCTSIWVPVAGQIIHTPPRSNRSRRSSVRAGAKVADLNPKANLGIDPHRDSPTQLVYALVAPAMAAQVVARCQAPSRLQRRPSGERRAPNRASCICLITRIAPVR